MAVVILKNYIFEHVPISSTCLMDILFPRIAQQPPVSQGLLIVEASRSHSDTPHSLGLLWTSDHLDILTKHNTHEGYNHAPSEPAIPASKRRQTHTLTARPLGSACRQTKGRFTHSMPFPCRARAVPLPCRAAKSLECVFPI